MKINRSAGILLHPTSLPGNYGIGDLGPEAYNFVNFLHSAGQNIWQVFPLGPTGYGDSPYQSFSAFAGNPLLISPDLLIDLSLITKDDVNFMLNSAPESVDYGKVIQDKNALLHIAYKNFSTVSKEDDNYTKFCKENEEWLDNYSLFMASKEFHGGKHWVQWEKDIAFRNENKLDEWKEKLSEQINYQKFVQYIFFKQWLELKNYANSKGIKIIGDLPIFVAYDSADTWADKNLFSLDQKGKLKTVAGVPPDYFSPTGQLWGNPLYNWDEMEKDDFCWWKKRFTKLLEIVDVVRIDHFRGFEAFWEVPGNAKTAENGKWVKAPGDKLFSSIKKHLGDLPIIAEDLGVITDEVVELRDKFNFPGLKVMQFAFGETGDKNFLPHNHIKNCVVYTGSHDNDTTKGFFENERDNGSTLYGWARNYLNYYGENICFHLIKTSYASVADTVIIPMQDVLNLGSEARMNFPGKLGNNWGWRFKWEQVHKDLAKTYNDLSKIYQRNSKG